MAQASDDYSLTDPEFVSRIRAIFSDDTCSSVTLEQLSKAQESTISRAKVDKFFLASVYGLLLEHSDLIQRPGQKLAAVFLIWDLYKDDPAWKNPLASLFFRFLRCGSTSLSQHNHNDGDELNAAENLFLKRLLVRHLGVLEMLSKTPREIHAMDARNLDSVDIRPFLDGYARENPGNTSPAVPFDDGAIAAFLQTFECTNPEFPDMRRHMSAFLAFATSMMPSAVENKPIKGNLPIASLAASSSYQSLSSNERPPGAPPAKIISSRVAPSLPRGTSTSTSAFRPLPTSFRTDCSSYLDLGADDKNDNGGAGRRLAYDMNDLDNKAFTDRLAHAMDTNPALVRDLNNDEEEEEDNDEDDLSSSNSMRANSNSNADDDDEEEDDDRVVETDEYDVDEDDDEDDDDEDDGDDEIVTGVKSDDEDSDDDDPDFDPTRGSDIVAAQRSAVSGGGSGHFTRGAVNAAATAASTTSDRAVNSQSPPALVTPSPTTPNKSPRRQQNSEAVADTGGSKTDPENVAPIAEPSKPADKIASERLTTTATINHHPHPNNNNINFRRTQQNQSHHAHQQRYTNNADSNNPEDNLKINWDIVDNDDLEYDHAHRRLRRGRVYEDLERKMSTIGNCRVAQALARTCLENINKALYTIPALAALDCLARHEVYGFDVIFVVVDNTNDLLNLLVCECENWCKSILGMLRQIKLEAEIEENREGEGQQSVVPKKKRSRTLSASSASMQLHTDSLELSALRLWYMHAWIDLLYRWRLQARKRIRDLNVAKKEQCEAAVGGGEEASSSIRAAAFDAECVKLLSLIERARKCHLNLDLLSRIWTCVGSDLNCSDQVCNFLTLCFVGMLRSRRRQHDTIDSELLDEMKLPESSSCSSAAAQRSQVLKFHDVRPYFYSMNVVLHILRQYLPEFILNRIADSTGESDLHAALAPSWPRSLDAALECYRMCCNYFVKEFDESDEEDDDSNGIRTRLRVLDNTGCTWQKLSLEAIGFLWSLTIDADRPNKIAAVVEAVKLPLVERGVAPDRILMHHTHDYILMRIIELLNCLTFDSNWIVADEADHQQRERSFLVLAVRRTQVLRDFVVAHENRTNRTALSRFVDDDENQQYSRKSADILIARAASAAIHRLVFLLVKHMAAYRGRYSFHFQVRSQMGQNVLPLVSSTTATSVLQATLVNTCTFSSSSSSSLLLSPLSTASSRIEITVQIVWIRKKLPYAAGKQESPLQFRQFLPIQMHVGDLKACILMHIYKKYEEDRGGFGNLWHNAKRSYVARRIYRRIRHLKQQSASQQPVNVSSQAVQDEIDAAVESDTDDDFDNCDTHAENERIYSAAYNAGKSRHRRVVAVDDDDDSEEKKKNLSSSSWFWQHMQKSTKESRKRLYVFNQFLSEHDALILTMLCPPQTNQHQIRNVQSVGGPGSFVQKPLINDQYMLCECGIRESTSGQQAYRLTATLEIKTRATGGAVALRAEDLRKSQMLIHECWPVLALLPHVYLSQSQNVDMLFDITTHIYTMLVHHEPTSRSTKNVELMEPHAVLYWRQCLRRIWELLTMLPAPNSLVAELTWFQYSPQCSGNTNNSAVPMKKSSSTSKIPAIANEQAVVSANKAAFWRKLLPFDAHEILLDDDETDDKTSPQRQPCDNVLPTLLYRLVVLERVRCGSLYAVFKSLCRKKTDDWMKAFVRDGGAQRLLNILTFMPLLDDLSSESMAQVPNEEFAWRRDILALLLRLLENLMIADNVEWAEFAQWHQTTMVRRFQAVAEKKQKEEQQSRSGGVQAEDELLASRTGKRRYSLTTTTADASAARCHTISENGSSSLSTGMKDSVDDARAALAMQTGAVGSEPPRKKTLLGRTAQENVQPLRTTGTAVISPLAVPSSTSPRVYSHTGNGTFFGAARPETTFVPPVAPVAVNDSAMTNNGSRVHKPISFYVGNNAPPAAAGNSVSFTNSRALPQQQQQPFQQQRNFSTDNAAIIEYTKQVNESLQRAKAVIADDRDTIAYIDGHVLRLINSSVTRYVHALLSLVSDTLPTLNSMPLLLDAINCGGVSSPQLLHDNIGNNGGLLISTYPSVSMFESAEMMRVTLLNQQKRIARSATRLLLSWAHASDQVVPTICGTAENSASSSSPLYSRWLRRLLVESLSDEMAHDQLQRLEELLRHHYVLYRDCLPLIGTLKLLLEMIPISVGKTGGSGANSCAVLVEAAIQECEEPQDNQTSDADEQNSPKISELTIALLDVNFQAFLSSMTPVSSVRLFTFLGVIIDIIPDELIKMHGVDLTSHLAWLTEQIALRPIFESRHTYFIANDGVGDMVLVGLLQVCLAILTRRPSLAVSHVELCARLAKLCQQILFAQPKIFSKVADELEEEVENSSPFEPKCKSGSSRAAAYALLNALCVHNAQLYRFAGERLILQHASPQVTASNAAVGAITQSVSSAVLYGWDYWPRDDIRSDCDRVGIVNLGATCYMACTMQQLFMIPQLREAVLRVRRKCEPTNALEAAQPAVDIGPKTESNSAATSVERILLELQHMFAYMMLSQRKAYNPDSFVRQYDMHGERLNPSEQKDMQEFYTDLLDKLSAMSPELKRVVGDTFEGRLCNSVICCDDECPHFSLRDEVFTSVHIPVQGYADVAASLEHVTAEDALEGDNKYFCAECKKMVRAMKRTSFRTLPKVLALNPMRYNFDTTTMARIKINSRFQFPDKLSMERFSEHNLLPQRVKQAQKVMAEEGMRRKSMQLSGNETFSMPSNLAAPAASPGGESVKENRLPVTVAKPTSLLAAALMQPRMNNSVSSASPIDDESESSSGSSRCSSTSITAGVMPHIGVVSSKKPIFPDEMIKTTTEPDSKRQRLTPPLETEKSTTANKSPVPMSMDAPDAAAAAAAVTSAGVGGLSPTPNEQQLQCFDYVLVGVTVHTGTSEAGHYYAYIYDLEAEGEQSQQWLSFNDTEVRRFDVSCLPNEAYGGNLPPITFNRGNHNDSLLGGGGYLDLALERCNSAYMLFYEREDVFNERRGTLNRIRDKIAVQKKTNSSLPQSVAHPWLANNAADPGIVRSERASRLRNRARMQQTTKSAPAVLPAIHDKSIMYYYVNSSVKLLPPELLQSMVADNCRFTSDLCVFDRAYTKFLLRFCFNALQATPQTTLGAQQRILAAAQTKQSDASAPSVDETALQIPLNDNACQFLATKLATMALLETLVHSRDKHYLNHFLELVTKCLATSSDCSEWFLDMLLQPTTMWLIDVLIRCPVLARRDLLKKLIILAFRSVQQRVVRKVRARSSTPTAAAGAEPQTQQQQYKALSFDYYFALLSFIQEQNKLKNSTASEKAVVAENTIIVDEDDEDGFQSVACFDSDSILLAKFMYKLISLVYAEETVTHYRYAGQLFEVISLVADNGDAECCALVHFGYLGACTRLYYLLSEQQRSGPQLGGGGGGAGNSSFTAATLGAVLLHATNGSSNSRGFSASSTQGNEPQQVSDDEFGSLNNGGLYLAGLGLENDANRQDEAIERLLRRQRNESTSSRLSNNNGNYLNLSGTNNFNALNNIAQQVQLRIGTAFEGMSATLRMMVERYQLFAIGAVNFAVAPDSTNNDDYDDSEWEPDFEYEIEVDENNDPVHPSAAVRSSSAVEANNNDAKQQHAYSIESTLYDSGVTEDDFIGMILGLIAESMSTFFVDGLAATLACFCLTENTITTSSTIPVAALQAPQSADEDGDDDDGFQPINHRRQPSTSENNDLDLSTPTLTHQQQHYISMKNHNSAATTTITTTVGEKSSKIIEILIDRICGTTFSQQLFPSSGSISARSTLNGGFSSVFGRPPSTTGNTSIFQHNSNNSFTSAANIAARQREAGNLIQATSLLARLSGQQYLSQRQAILAARQRELNIKTAVAAGTGASWQFPVNAKTKSKRLPMTTTTTQCSTFIDLILPRVAEMFSRYPESVVDWLQTDAVRIESLRAHVIRYVADMIRLVLVSGVNSFSSAGQQQQYRFSAAAAMNDKYAVGSFPSLARKDREQLVQQLCVLALLVAMPFTNEAAAAAAMPTADTVHNLITQALNQNGGGSAAMNYEEHPMLLRYLSTTANRQTPLGLTPPPPTRTLAAQDVRVLFSNLFSVVGWLEVVYGRIQHQVPTTSAVAANSTNVSIVVGDSISAYFLVLTWLMDASQDDLVCHKFQTLQIVFNLQMRLQPAAARDDMRWSLMLFIAAGVKYLPKFRFMVLHDAEMQHFFLRSPLISIQQQQMVMTNSLLTAGASFRNNGLPVALAAVMAAPNANSGAFMWHKNIVLLKCLGQWLIYKSNLALVDRRQCAALYCGNDDYAATAGNTAAASPFTLVLADMLSYAAEIIPNTTGSLFGTPLQQQVMHCVDQCFRILFEFIPRKLAEGSYSNEVVNFFPAHLSVAATPNTTSTSRATVAEPSSAAAQSQLPLQSGYGQRVAAEAMLFADNNGTSPPASEIAAVPVCNTPAPAAYIEQLLAMPVHSMPSSNPAMEQQNSRFQSIIGHVLSPPTGARLNLPVTAMLSRTPAAVGESIEALDSSRIKQILYELRLQAIQSLVSAMSSYARSMEIGAQRFFRLIRRLLYCPSDTTNMTEEEMNEHLLSRGTEQNDDGVAACFELDADDCRMLLSAFRYRIYVPLVSTIAHHVQCYKHQLAADQAAAAAIKRHAAAAAASAVAGNKQQQQQTGGLGLNSSGSTFTGTPSPVMAIFTRDIQNELQFAITRLQTMLGLVEPRTKQLKAELEEVDKQLMLAQQSKQSLQRPSVVSGHSNTKSDALAAPASVVDGAEPKMPAASPSKKTAEDEAVSATGKADDFPSSSFVAAAATAAQLEQRRIAIVSEHDALVECRQNVDQLLHTHTRDIGLNVNLSMLIDYGFDIFVNRLSSRSTQQVAPRQQIAAASSNSAAAAVANVAGIARKRASLTLDDDGDDIIGDEYDEDEDDDDGSGDEDDYDEADDDDEDDAVVEHDEEDDDDDDDELDDEKTEVSEKEKRKIYRKLVQQNAKGLLFKNNDNNSSGRARRDAIAPAAQIDNNALARALSNAAAFAKPGELASRSNDNLKWRIGKAADGKLIRLTAEEAGDEEEDDENDDDDGHVAWPENNVGEQHSFLNICPALSKAFRQHAELIGQQGPLTQSSDGKLSQTKMPNSQQLTLSKTRHAEDQVCNTPPQLPSEKKQ